MLKEIKTRSSDYVLDDIIRTINHIVRTINVSDSLPETEKCVCHPPINKRVIEGAPYSINGGPEKRNVLICGNCKCPCHKETKKCGCQGEHPEWPYHTEHFCSEVIPTQETKKEEKGIPCMCNGNKHWYGESSCENYELKTQDIPQPICYCGHPKERHQSADVDKEPFVEGEFDRAYFSCYHCVCREYGEQAKL